ncbi:hypothetical protein JUM001_04040 [Clostridium perfringens]|uniref:beta family protein n=1 Tax=Clostridium perfringens TaxID=1502 RepID=UPI0021FAF3F0|nr:beta family protein [Clostridium perfringens]BDS16170.1 hypothetical protein JUM001_04040 [Clostridium perfringens]
MYVPIMKTRQEELRVSKKINHCFSDEIIPLFEVVKEIYGENGKIKKIKGKITKEDIITLDYINNTIKKSKAFIDYFRFDSEKYGGNKIDISKIELAYKLSRSESEYIEKLNSISSYDNLIPVISIKEKFTFNKSKLIEIINMLQDKSTSIAIRIEDSLFESLKDVIEKHLRESDFLLYDINEQNIESKVIELLELNECDVKSKKILLNSPRKLNINNKQYENGIATELIDNSVATSYEEYNFDGFGDFGGLKDQLPTSGGNGKGAALALIYNKEENLFYSFCNSDTSLGTRGYVQVISDILDLEYMFNPQQNCPFYQEVNKMFEKDSTGNFGKWNNLTLTRYIHQTYISIKE